MMSLKIALNIVSILSAMTSAYASSECVEGKTRHILYNKEVITNENYCYDLESGMLFSSDPCASDKVCMSKDLDSIDFKLSSTNFEIGSPGFKICDKYNGKPQIMDFWADNQWRPSSHCIFTEGSFIDNSALSEKANFSD